MKKYSKIDLFFIITFPLKQIIFREPNDINESLRKYKLQPVTNSNGSAEEIEMNRLRTVEVEDNVNMIQLVETVTVNVEVDQEEKDQSCNSQSRDWLC